MKQIAFEMNCLRYFQLVKHVHVRLFVLFSMSDILTTAVGCSLGSDYEADLTRNVDPTNAGKDN